MKQGIPLRALAQEIERQSKTKRDFKSPSTKLRLALMPNASETVRSPEGFKMRHILEMNGVGQFPVRRLFHDQLSERLKIPKPYYDRMLAEDSAILESNVNYWFKQQEEVRLVRTLDGQARAYLGDKYRPMDNWDLFQALAPTLMGSEAQSLGISIQSCMITETEFFIKAFSTRLTGEIKVGDVVQAGVTIINSEVGKRLIAIDPSILILSCLNGATRSDGGLRRRHVGRGSEGVEDAEEFFSDATRRADDHAFWRKVADVVRGCFNEVMFRAFLDRARAAAENRIPRDSSLDEIKEVAAQRYGLSDSEGDLLLRNLIEGKDLTQYGLSNAMTLLAQHDSVSYTRATELEKFGGAIIELPKSEWETLVEV